MVLLPHYNPRSCHFGACQLPAAAYTSCQQTSPTRLAFPFFFSSVVNQSNHRHRFISRNLAHNWPSSSPISVLLSHPPLRLTRARHGQGHDAPPRRRGQSPWVQHYPGSCMIDGNYTIGLESANRAARLPPSQPFALELDPPASPRQAPRPGRRLHDGHGHHDGLLQVH